MQTLKLNLTSYSPNADLYLGIFDIANSGSLSNNHENSFKDNCLPYSYTTLEEFIIVAEGDLGLVNNQSYNIEVQLRHNNIEHGGHSATCQYLKGKAVEISPNNFELQ